MQLINYIIRSYSTDKRVKPKQQPAGIIDGMYADGGWGGDTSWWRLSWLMRRWGWSHRSTIVCIKKGCCCLVLARVASVKEIEDETAFLDSHLLFYRKCILYTTNWPCVNRVPDLHVLSLPHLVSLRFRRRLRCRYWTPLTLYTTRLL